MMKRMDKKAFTLIELLVVVAVVGVLVLLGIPRFIGHTQGAERTRIQHDIKVMEQEIGTVLINNDDDIDKWEDNNKDFNQLIQEGKLFEKEGVAKEEPIDGPYKVIPEKYKDKINTKLKGTFYTNSDGKVYYEHTKPLSGITTEPEKEPVYSEEEVDVLTNNCDFIPVATADELNSIRSDEKRTYGKGTKWERECEGGLDKQYIQVANIDLSGYGGWNPIGSGDDGESVFTGIYDGGNYVIRGLEVKDQGKNYQGLFGITDGAIISNVGLIENKVTGTDTIGGLVGLAHNSTISNSYATGEVAGSHFVGGLVGEASGVSTTISNSYATDEVTGSYYVGGLVGKADSITIDNSYATGSVKRTKDNLGGRMEGPGDYVGGLVGGAHNSTTISNSYATGKVEGTSGVGGLVGSAEGDTFGDLFENTTISNSYATGSVIGTSDVGGLLGRDKGSTIENSYWDKETTGRPTSSGEGKGKTTDEMKKADTYAAWGTDVWNIVNGEYPTLKNRH